MRIEVFPESGYVWIRCQGAFEFSHARQIVSTVEQAKQRYAANIFLIDALALTGQIDTLERYDIGVLMASQFMGGVDARLKKLALVGKPPLFESTRFAESVAQMRGGNVKIFFDKQAAIDWLLE